jgi:hypothetical protein
MASDNKFTCVIDDHGSEDRFSAEVTVEKCLVCRPEESTRKTQIADIYIEPVSDRVFFYSSKKNWNKKPGSFNVPTKEKSGSHNHFVLFELSGAGMYIVRDNHRREIVRRTCSIWDLGQSFGEQVMKALNAG